MAESNKIKEMPVNKLMIRMEVKRIANIRLTLTKNKDVQRHVLWY